MHVGHAVHGGVGRLCLEAGKVAVPELGQIAKSLVHVGLIPIELDGGPGLGDAPGLAQLDDDPAGLSGAISPR